MPASVLQHWLLVERALPSLWATLQQEGRVRSPQQQEGSYLVRRFVTQRQQGIRYRQSGSLLQK